MRVLVFSRDTRPGRRDEPRTAWVLACVALAAICFARPALADEDGYRSAGLSFGFLYKSLTGSGAYEEYVESTDSYRFLPSEGRNLWGFSIGGHVWSQRTSLHFEFARSGDQFLYSEERSLLGGGTTDTFVYIHYTTFGFRLRQALVTRRVMVNVGYSWIEEERVRKSDKVDTQSFPADTFPMLSWGLDIAWKKWAFLGFVREWSFDHDGIEELSSPIEGWTSNSLHITFVY